MKNMTVAQAYKEQFGKVSYPFKIYDTNGNLTYYEARNGYWWKYKYDTNGNRTYLEASNGYWWKYEYDASEGYWAKYEYDANSNLTYIETSDGYWAKHEYDASGNDTYYEDSYGCIEGNKNK